ncbi:variant surface glycoprotein (VSG, atypical), putative [Trypanosoma equiperdum]|uniref:Variant surface glycoprotein (VSG, atypical), putative n=1 Tax=Trypanosoma equiperdum TaxID=5694 RepID=A0A1G4IB64_TRYEQ|nr:variant surface glycoprotein (VSG, atypical), putative [Trypanosoma equiperdum]
MSQRPNTATAATALALVIASVDGAQDSNGRQHSILCRLLALATMQPQVPKITPETDDLVATLEELNFSTSDQRWKANFNFAANAEKASELPDRHKNQPYTTEWTALWPRWYRAGKAASDAGLGQATNKEYPPIADPIQQQAAHAAISRLLMKATALQQEISKLKRASGDFGTAAITAELQTAAYGRPGATAPDAPHSIPSLHDWDTGCTKQSAGTSLAGDAMCLCNGDETNPKECGVSGNWVQWNSQKTAEALFAPVTESCPGGKPDKLSGALVEAALADFTAALTEKSTGTEKVVVLGTTNGNKCDGSAAKLCVDYSDNFKKGPGTGVDKIKWAKHLRNAAELAEKSNVDVNKAHTLAVLAQALKIEATGVYTAAVQKSLVTPSDVKQQANDSKAREQTQGIAGNQKQQNTCQEETDKDKCTEKNGCEFKDGECKTKVAETTGGTDAKNTNTTGSNSFVVKKAPLLLAVLLLV